MAVQEWPSQDGGYSAPGLRLLPVLAAVQSCGVTVGGAGLLCELGFT